MGWSFKYEFPGEILQRLWEWIENIQVASYFPDVWKVMFDETWIIQPFCCISTHSGRQTYESLLHDMIWTTVYTDYRFVVISIQKYHITRDKLEKHKNPKVHKHIQEPLKLYWFHVSNFFKLPLFIQKNTSEPTPTDLGVEQKLKALEDEDLDSLNRATLLSNRALYLGCCYHGPKIQRDISGYFLKLELLFTNMIEHAPLIIWPFLCFFQQQLLG